MDNYHTQQPAFQQEAWPKQQGADVTGERGRQIMFLPDQSVRSERHPGTMLFNQLIACEEYLSGYGDSSQPAGWTQTFTGEACSLMLVLFHVF